MKKAIEFQANLESRLKARYKKLKPKDKRLAKFSIRILIFMLFCLYFSGLIKTQYDLLYAIIAMILLGVTLFFVKLKNY